MYTYMYTAQHTAHMSLSGKCTGPFIENESAK